MTLMNKRRFLVLLLLACFQTACKAQPQRSRPAAVAGAFYPSDAKELARMLDGFLAAAKPVEIKDVVALVAPHAGYIYSGGVAANSYALLKGRKVERVVVISRPTWRSSPSRRFTTARPIRLRWARRPWTRPSRPRWPRPAS